MHAYENDGDMYKPPVYLAPLLYAARGIPFEMQHHFNQLTTLDMNYSSKHPSHMSALFRLPNLECLTLFSAEMSHKEFREAYRLGPSEVNAWECPPESSRVRRLSLCSTLPSQVIDNMLRTCSSLRPFAFNGDVCVHHEPGWFHNVAKSLKIHQGSLERVRLDGAHYDWLIVPSALAG
ncbi:hypothetical protein EJ02DRAFT_68004 [Clathrospora elynae]|uniref:Uncharacterized protein n=1 Tax=Clathrospora elynae TaxID=706981 RepID=A0A6A5SC21_9PLEO|nr:hypothetical protein EJ02DRAFT_68004 [Clathrospora elynae]